MINLEKLIDIISLVLEVDQEINIDSSSDTISEWDSMAQILITSEISDLTNAKSDDIEELFEVHSVKGILELLNDNNLIDS